MVQSLLAPRLEIGFGAAGEEHAPCGLKVDRDGVAGERDVARVVLPWPFGGLVAWMSDISLALMLSLLLAWDRQAGASNETNA
jgi:hypothetical protein